MAYFTIGDLLIYYLAKIFEISLTFPLSPDGRGIG